MRTSSTAKSETLLSNIVGQFKVSVRLGLMVLIPLLGLIGYTYQSIEEKRAISENLSQTVGLAKVTGALGDLVTALQREAGLSAAFATSKGAKMRAELSVARGATSVSVKQLKDVVASTNFKVSGGAAAQAYLAAEANVDQIDAKRAAIDAQSLPIDELNDFYTFGLIGKLLDVTLQTLPLIKQADLQILGQAYENVIWLKEMSGATRANAVAGFTAGKFNSELHTRIVTFSRRQDVYKAAFKLYATPEERLFYDRTMIGSAVEKTESLTKAVVDSAENADFAGKISAEDWIAATSARIDLLAAVEARLRDDFVGKAGIILADADASVRAYSMVGGGLVLVTLVLAWLMMTSLNRPIVAIARSMERLASGDLDTVIPFQGNRDEIGLMARAVEVFKINAVERKRLEQAELERAEKEQAVLQEERRKAVASLTSSFESSVSGVLETVLTATAEMSDVAQSMSANAEQTTGQAALVATAGRDASESVQTVASAAEELSISIGEIGRQMAQSSRVARLASEDASRTNETVKGLADSSARISAVVKLINDIASQTNLLALNATIEAARAGDAGKGFAVVAGEVKNLANQTARATEEISGQIGAVQTSTQEAISAIGDIVARIEEINQIAGSTASAVEQQTAATAEIARNIQLASSGTQQVAANIGGVSHAAAETGAAAGQVLSSARSLSNEASVLRETVDQFLRNVRAA